MRSFFIVALLGIAIVCTSPTSAQTATTFTYQGHLAQNGTPVDGAYEFEVRLLDGSSAQIGFTEVAAAEVTDGAFAIALDFGNAAFDGNSRFLEISVRSVAGGGAYTTLSPNQRVTSTPVAQFALSGNEGPTGPQGEAGQDGPTGPQGDPGNDGEPGEEGAPGIDGTDGDPGDDGVQGIQGIQGIQGTQGIQGDPGSPGDSHWTLSGVNTYFNSGKVGIGTDSPSYPLHVVSSNTTRAITATTMYSQGVGIFAAAMDSSGSNFGIVGRSMSTSGTGVFGAADASSGTNYGVRGEANSPDGYAGYFEGGQNYFEGKVGIGTDSPSYPLHVVSSNTTRAITATTMHSQGVGIFAAAMDSSGSNFGIVGRSMSSSGTGLFGAADASSGTNYGVRGVTNSPDGYAGYFEGGRNYFEGDVGIGTDASRYPLEVRNHTQSAFAIYAHTVGDTSIRGSANSSASISIGGWFSSADEQGRGVYGVGEHYTGVNYGVWGKTNSPDGYAGYFQGGKNYFEGDVGIGTDTPSYPLEVINNSLSPFAIYAHTIGDTSIRGSADSSAQISFGGWFSSADEQGRGVYGVAENYTGVNYGVYGRSNSLDGFAGYFEGQKNYFEGRVGIGTDSPSDKLHISAPALVNAFRVQTDGITRIRVNANGGVSLGGNSTIIGAGDVYIANRLGIGTNAPTFDLSVSGTAAKSGGGSWSVFSDQRLKKNIAPMVGSLDVIDALRPVNFEYKAEDHFSYTPGVQRGFIAQEVQKVIPQWVNTADDGYLYLDQIGYEALIVDAIQELRAEKDAENQELKDEMRQLLSEKDREIQQLQTRLDRLERMVTRSNIR